jgi:hypothetical protein
VARKNQETGVKMNVRFFDIVWDTDGEEASLPSTVLASIPEMDVNTEGADFLSDEYGFCVFSFDFDTV